MGSRRAKRALSNALKFVSVVLLVSLAALLLLDLLPGDPAVAIAGERATEEQVEQVRERLGLDRPLPQRFVEWLGDIARLDFGRSLTTQQPVSEAIRERLPVTLQLAVLSLIVALAIAIPIGAWCGYHAGGVVDRIVTAATSALLSMPSFLLAVLLVFLLAVNLDLFPVTSWVRLTADPVQNLRHAALPVLSLAIPEAVVYIRLLRNDMASTVQENYLLAAKARGLTTGRLMFSHALRPSSFSLVTVAGISFGRLVGGTVIVEYIFGLPGLGQLAISAINARDFVTVRGVVVVMALGYLVVNAVVDLLYPALDPRLRARRA